MLKLLDSGLYACTFVLTLNSLFLVREYLGQHTHLTHCIPPVCPSCSIASSASSAAIANSSETVDTSSFESFDNPMFRPINSFVPPGKSTLSRVHLQNSFTRIASELDFNTQSCPKDSLVLTDWQHMEPMYSSCPALFLIGARKGGTTSFYQYLSHHPDFKGINLETGPKAGETFHFSSRYYTEKWTTYMAKFPKQMIMTGDASVGNLVNCDVPRRIFETCKNFSKIILLLRNPVDRFCSNFNMRANLGSRHFSNYSVLSTAIRVEFDRYFEALIAAGIDPGTPVQQVEKHICLFAPSRNMVFEGLYYVHLYNWLCNYPAENILIISSEEFFVRTAEVMSQAFHFLGLSPVSNEMLDFITSTVYNKGKKSLLPYQQLSLADKKKIKSIYGPFNNKLFELLHWTDIDYW